MLEPEVDAALQESQTLDVDQANEATGQAPRVHPVEPTSDQLAREIAYQMAYGLSHELNNPLANIASRARLLAECESDVNKRQMLQAIVDQAMRGCEMIADLMLYARPPEPSGQPTPIPPLIEQLYQQAQLWSQSRSLNCRLLTAFLPQCSITIDRASWLEAVWALIRNAIEAARTEVTLAVCLDHVQPAVIIEINDDGAGLSSEALSSAFHPFFSGREAGRGIGLGLSKAQRFIELSGGRVTLVNRHTGGCQCTVTMPLAPVQ